jgi:hypothetical protein
MRKACRKWWNEECQRQCNGQQHADEHYGPRGNSCQLTFLV